MHYHMCNTWGWFCWRSGRNLEVVGLVLGKTKVLEKGSWKSEWSQDNCSRIRRHVHERLSCQERLLLPLGWRHAIPAIVNNHTVRWHVEKRGDERCDVQHDNATSHKSAHSQLNKAGGRYKGGTLKIRFVRQTPDSPNFNRNDLGLYNSLWCWVSKESEMKMMTRDQS